MLDNVPLIERDLELRDDEMCLKKLTKLNPENFFSPARASNSQYLDIVIITVSRMLTKKLNLFKQYTLH